MSVDAFQDITPSRVQLSRRAGWKMPPNTIKVDRSTKWGNPFINHDGDKAGNARAASLFSALLERQGGWLGIQGEWIDLEDVSNELAGRNLAYKTAQPLLCWSV